MHVSWSPIALCSSAATTEESTPPLRPSTTFSSPTCRPHARAGFVNERAHRPIHGAVTNVKDKILKDLLPARRVRDFGMKLQIRKASGRHLPLRRNRNFPCARDAKSFRQRRHLVAVTVPDVDLRPNPSKRASHPVRCSDTRAIFAAAARIRPVLRDDAPSTASRNKFRAPECLTRKSLGSICGAPLS